MGTIAEKLNYLNDTRLKIKDGLNKFGADLTENDTFRSYSNVLNDIYDKLPKVSGNGSNFSLENAQNGKLDSFGMDGNTEQTTYSGINILLQNEYISSQTVNGITYTNNGDGTFNLSGTATANTSLRIIDVGVFNLESGQAYYLYSSVPYNNGTFNMSIVTIEDRVNKYFIANTTYTPSTTPTNSRLQFYVASGNTVNVQNVKLMLVKGSTAPTDYEPYVGGTPSPNPDYPQDIKVVENEQVVNVHRKNLFDLTNIENNSTGRTTYTINNDEITITAISDGTYRFIYKTIPVEIGETYTFKIGAYNDSSTGGLAQWGIVNSQGQYYYYYKNLKTNQQLSFTPTENTITFRCGYLSNSCATNDVLKISQIQLELGNQATPYEAYNGTTYNIDLPEDMELCKIGDYKDSIKKSTGKNLFDGGWSNGSIGSNGQNISDSKSIRTTGIGVKSGVQYTFSSSTTTSINEFWINYYNGDAFVSREYFSSGNTQTFIVPSGVNIARFRLTATTDINTNIINNVQLEQNSQATEYEPYGEQWYIKKEIGKVVLNGSQSINTANTQPSDTNYKNYTYSFDDRLISSDAVCNYFSYDGIANTSKLTEASSGKFYSSSSSMQIIFKTKFASSTDFKTWLSTHNTIVYYALATPTYETITDETLISQLEAIETHTGTNIFEVSNDNDVLPSLNVKRLKELEKLS